MTLRRFQFQEEMIKLTTGKVLNVGAANDWANYRERYRGRVVNTDIHRFLPGENYLYSGEGEPDSADLYFDCTQAPWPVGDKEYELVILGEVLEHLTNLGAVTALKEALRVADYLCITTPLDPDFLGSEDSDAVAKGGAHISLMTEDVLTLMLELSGWSILDWDEVDYEFTPRGHFISAEDPSIEYEEIISG